MPTFQDARDGMDALLKDGKGNLSPDDKDKAIVNAGRTFSRKFPRVIAEEANGNGGFEYDLPASWVEGYSTITGLIFPWDPTEQNPTRLERKDYRIFEGPNGTKLRFVRDVPAASQKYLIAYTVPHTIAAAGIDSIGVLDAAGSVIAGSDVPSANAIDVETAEDVQIFLKVTAAAGTLLDVIVEASPDGVDYAPIAAFNEITGLGDYVLPLPPERVSKFIRLVYTTTGGSFTLTASVVKPAAGGTFTVIDAHLDAFTYLAASIAAQQLANFYSNLVDSQLDGETTDYEGKATFWQNNYKDWDARWKEAEKELKPTKGVTAFAQPEWDLRGTTGFSYLTHDERQR